MSAAPQLRTLEGGLSAAASPSLPASVEAEEYLLSALLLDTQPTAWALCRQIGLKPAAFTRPAHRIVWESIDALWTGGTQADLTAVYLRLQETKQLDAVGGLDGLVALSARSTTTGRVRPLAETLRHLWELRHAIVSAGQYIEDLRGLTGGPDEFLSASTDLGQRLLRLGHRHATTTLVDTIGAVRDELIARSEGREDRSRWLSTGLASFDEKLRPFGSAREDHIIVIAGASGTGKSALMCQLAWAILQNPAKTVLVYSRETTNAGFIARALSAAHGVDLQRPDRMPKERIAAFVADCDRLAADIADKRLFCVENTPSTPILLVEELAANYQAHCHLRGVPDVVVIDYLQLFGTKKRCQSREQEVAVVSHTLAALQRSTPNAVFLIGCQMNETGRKEQTTLKRDDQGRPIHRLPQPGDLRESQAIYHDADRVIAIYRPPVDCRDQDQLAPGLTRPEQWLVQIKRRGGSTGLVKCWFEMPYTRFVELHASDHAAAAPANPGPMATPMTKSDWKSRQRPLS